MKSVAGAGVVVTGGGSGIGAAMARRFAAEGARVVVNDLSADAAKAVAASCGAVPVGGDAAGEEGVAALIAAARHELGEIDLYCANAGVAIAGGPETSEADWDASWQVNVMAHVRAARLLIGPWLERGSGHLICTVSAAGLLAMPGTLPYSVTKHAALSFAEWMAFSYLHRGISAIEASSLMIMVDQAAYLIHARTTMIMEGPPPGSAGCCSCLVATGRGPRPGRRTSAPPRDAGGSGTGRRQCPR